MKIIYNSIIPFKGYKAINLFGVLFVRKSEQLSEIDLNHERIHTAQMKDLFYVFFYVFYLFEFIVLLLRHKKWYKAYRSISFEREAYDNQSNLNYLDND